MTPEDFYAWHGDKGIMPYLKPDMSALLDDSKRDGMLSDVQAIAEEQMLSDPLYYGLEEESYSPGDADDMPIMRARESCVSIQRVISRDEWDTIARWGNDLDTKEFVGNAGQAGHDTECVKKCMNGASRMACAVAVKMPGTEKIVAGFFGN